MSRAAALDTRKGEQKEAIALKKAEHAADLAMGLTSTMAKVIKQDELLCTGCGATKLGPLTQCNCAGGRCKPGPGFCPKRLLLDAAKARFALAKAAEMKDAAKKQDAVAGSRTKKREGAAVVDLEAECQGDGVEMQVVVQFPIGKLGMGLEKNCVSKVTGEPAQELGVQPGWVLFSVGGEQTPQDTAAITKIVTRVFKEKKAGLVDFKFRVPIVSGLSHCVQCDKFVDDAEFDAAQRAAGPGKQMCGGCEEIACMGF